MEDIELKHKLKNDGYIYLKASGGSMRPWIKSGSILKINAIDTGKASFATTDTNRIRIGDIVLYEVQEQFLVHRVIKKIGKIFIIAGDNRIDTVLHRVNEEQIFGIVEHSNRIKRIFELFLVMPIHYIYVIARFIHTIK